MSIPISKKPVASRMGKGKGNIVFWIGVIRAGKIIIEINSISTRDCIRILTKAATKLPLKTKIIQLYF
jgi:large subunit ribosomal protein L16